MLDKARQLSDQLVSWRRDFHMHPELGFQETRTAARVGDVLEALGYRVRRGVGRTGVTAEIGSAELIVAIRADMDALPIEEANPVPYASLRQGVMHACGHDAHTAMALGAATLLAREEFRGAVRFLFQPSEEIADAEGISGAPRMAADGAMEGVDAIVALHVDASTPAGTIRVDAGPASGGVDTFFGRLIGRGGHGAKPHATVDPFFIAAHVIFALNGIVSRRLSPFAPAVVSLGALHGGDAPNVIPESVRVAGTLRYTERVVREQIHAEIRRAFELARTLGGDYTLEFETGNRPMNNDARVVQLIQAAAGEMLGAEHVLPMHKDLGAEDFGVFSDLKPGAMFMLGARVEGDERYGHNPRFDIDERALPIGTALLAECALRFLRRGGLR